jgi:hypothetical protein
MIEATEIEANRAPEQRIKNEKARVYGLFQWEKSNPSIGKIKSSKREKSNPFEVSGPQRDL